MICGSLQCASVTGMALQGSMKSLLIVPSGNWSSQFLALIDLFTFQRLDPTRRENTEERGGAGGRGRTRGINRWIDTRQQPGYQY